MQLRVTATPFEMRLIPLTWWQALADAERGRLALWLPVALGAGDLAYFARTTEPPAWLGLAALLPCLAIAWLTRRHLALRAFAWLLTAAALGFTAAQLATWRAPPLAALPRRATIIEAKVGAVDTLPRGRRVLLVAPRLDGQPPLPRTLRVRLRANDPVIPEQGDTLRLRALVRPPAPPALPGAWDLQRDAYFAGLAGYGYALSPVTTLTHGSGGLEALRETIAARVEAALPGADGTIAATLLTGLASAIPPDIRTAFRDAGLAHLLAIAGLHIGIVMGLVFGLVRLTLAAWPAYALRWSTKSAAGLAALAAGGAYAVLTGMHVPILRSFAMASLVTLGLLAGRRAASLRGLALAATALILLAPSEITGVSFQMSFSAVLALIAGYAAMRPAFARLAGGGWRKIASHVATLALTSLLAGTASAPFAAYHFGRVQLYNVAANLAAVPITAFWVMPWGLVSLAAMPLGLERWPLQPMGWGIAVIIRIGESVAAWPGAVWAIPHMPAWGLAIVALAMAWLGLWRSRLRLLALPVLALGLASPWLIRPPDLLIAPDARVIALRTPAGAYAQVTGGADPFVSDADATYWGLPNLADLADAPPPYATCTAGTCLLRTHPSGPAALLFTDPAATTPPCGQAILTLSAEPLSHVCPGLPVIDRFTVWREGAQAVWLDPAGPRLLSEAQVRGARPWSATAPARATRPLAHTEELPPE